MAKDAPVRPGRLQEEASLTFKSYVAPLHGERVVEVPGRVERLRLPCPAELPASGRRCFFCHPHTDAYDRGPWGPLHVLGNAHPVGDPSLLLFPPGEAHHASVGATLSPELHAAAWSALDDPAFRARFGLDGGPACAYLNTGRASGQSQRHPHLQVVGWTEDTLHADARDRDAIEDDLAHAKSEGRLLEGGAVLPRAPSMTAEVWIPMPEAGDADGWRDCARRLVQLLAACEASISASYNVGRIESPRLLRLVPRGLCERAGLELCAPRPVDALVGGSREEIHRLWSRALEG